MPNKEILLNNKTIVLAAPEPFTTILQHPKSSVNKYKVANEWPDVKPEKSEVLWQI